MGWGIDFTADIFLSRVSINNEGELDDLIEETEESIATCKTALAMLAIANVKDIVPMEWVEEPTRWVQIQINELFKSLRDDIEFLQNLRSYKKYLNEPKN